MMSRKSRTNNHFGPHKNQVLSQKNSSNRMLYHVEKIIEVNERYETLEATETSERSCNASASTPPVVKVNSLTEGLLP